MQTGWFKEVRVKGLDNHSVSALLASRALLVKIKRDLENQIRGRAVTSEIASVKDDANAPMTAVRSFSAIRRRATASLDGPLRVARQHMRRPGRRNRLQARTKELHKDKERSMT